VQVGGPLGRNAKKTDFGKVAVAGNKFEENAPSKFQIWIDRAVALIFTDPDNPDILCTTTTMASFPEEYVHGIAIRLSRYPNNIYLTGPTLISQGSQPDYAQRPSCSQGVPVCQ
jgi:hypothetical protein